MNTKDMKIQPASLNQLFQIIDLLINSSNNFNLISLSKKLDLPIGLTRNVIADFAVLQPLFQVYIGNELYSNIKNKKYTYFVGQYDTYPLSVTSNLVIVTPKELNRYQKFFKTYQNNSTKNNISLPEYLMKEDYQNITGCNYVFEHKLRQMQSAFSKKIPFLCYTKSGHAIFPIALYHDAITAKVFCAVLSDGIITFYPLENIDKIRATEKLANPYSEFEISTTLHLLKYIWSPHPVSLYSEPTLFRILLKNEPNTIEKIRHDVSNYEAEFTEQSDGSFMLDIKIINSDSFFSWLLSYGSSITVLEPLSTREKIIETYKNIIQQNS